MAIGPSLAYSYANVHVYCVVVYIEMYINYLIMLSKRKFSEIVGRNIKQWRETSGVSQEDLAHKAGFYRTYIGHLENAKYTPSAYTLYRIAKALKVKLSELIP